MSLFGIDNLLSGYGTGIGPKTLYFVDNSGAAMVPGWGDNGPAAVSSLRSGGVWGLALDPAVDIFIGDGNHNRIRKIANATVPPPQLSVSPSSVTMIGPFSNNPAPVTIEVNSTGGGMMHWTATPMPTDPSWLTFTPGTGTAPMVTPGFTITALGEYVAPGVYSASLVVSPISSLNESQPTTVSIQSIVGVPRYTAASLVNSASLQNQSLASRAICSLFGGNFGSATLIANQVPLPTTLGITVTVNGVAAPLFFVSPTQVRIASEASTSRVKSR